MYQGYLRGLLAVTVDFRHPRYRYYYEPIQIIIMIVMVMQ